MRKERANKRNNRPEQETIALFESILKGRKRVVWENEEEPFLISIGEEISIWFSLLSFEEYKRFKN